MHAQGGVGLALLVLSRGAGAGGSGRGSALGDDGSWACSLCPSCLPPTLISVTSAIYSEVYFLYQMPSPAWQELMGAHWEVRPCSSALSACSMDTNHFSMVGQDPPAPQPFSPGAAVVLPALQCWKGAGTCQSPWDGLGAWVVLFCFVLWKCALWMPHFSWGWTGGLFSIWPESGLPNESQVNNTFFKNYSNVSIRIHRKLNFVFGFN